MPAPGFPSSSGSIYYREKIPHWRDSNTGITGNSREEVRRKLGGTTRAIAPRSGVANVNLEKKKIAFQGKMYSLRVKR